MRTLLEIIEAAKRGDKPDYDECYYAMLALNALYSFDSQVILDLHPSAGKIYTRAGLERVADESFQRGKRCYAVDPKHYIGWDNDPANPDYQKFRKMVNKLFDKLTGEKS